MVFSYVSLCAFSYVSLCAAIITEVRSFAMKKSVLRLIERFGTGEMLITGSFLRRLVSCYVHPFGHRRELNCVFNRIHKYRSSIGLHSLQKLPPDIRDEILMATCLLPLAASNIRWPVSSEVY